MAAAESVKSGSPLVSVCLVTRNRQESLARAWKSVLSQEVVPMEAILVDNASDDTGYLDEWDHGSMELLVHRSEVNLGCPPGRNLAMESARGEFLLHLDDDGWLAPGALLAGLRVMKADDRIGVVAFEVIERGRSLLPGAVDGEELGWFCGGACLMRRKALCETGLYDDAFFRQSEEVDLAIRLLDRGWKIQFCRAAVMYHEPGHSRKREGRDLILDAVNYSTTVLKFCPARRLPQELFLAACRFFKQFCAVGKPWLMFNCLIAFIPRIRYALGHRRPRKLGFDRFIELESRRHRQAAVPG